MTRSHGGGQELATCVMEVKEHANNATSDFRSKRATEAVSQGALYLTAAWEACGTWMGALMVNGLVGRIALHAVRTYHYSFMSDEGARLTHYRSTLSRGSTPPMTFPSLHCYSRQRATTPAATPACAIS